MLRSKIIIQSCLVLLVLNSGCRLGEEYSRSQEITPEAFRYTASQSETIADLPWWELFKDSTLVALIDTALANNLDLATAASRIRQGDAQLNIVRANLFPRVNYGASASYDLTSAGNQSSVVAGTPISYQVDLWGRFRNLRDASYYEFLASEEAYRTITLALVRNVADAYFLLRDLDNRLIITENTAETWKENLSITQARNNAGLVSEVVVNQANIQVEEAKANIQTFRRLRVQTENSLSILLGVPPMDIPRGMPLQDQILPPQPPIGFPSFLLDRRPDIRSIENQLQAQMYRVGATQALQYPNITISADLGASLLNPVTTFANLGGQLFGPIFNLGENRRRVEIEREFTEQLFLGYQNAFINAMREVEDALVAVDTYSKELESRKNQVHSANQALELAWVRYDNGVTSYLEILDLQRTSFNTMLRASEIMRLQLTSTVDLYSALGGGWIYETDTINSNK